MPPHFTNLPREIRDAILELCLVVGVVDPHPLSEDRDPFFGSTRKPDIALLAVNKKINAEGTEILYGENVWVINRSFKGEGQREWVSQAAMDEIWHIHRNLIRHVRMSLRNDDPKSDVWRLATDKMLQTPPEKTTTRSLVDIVHMHRESLLIDASQWKMKICQDLGLKSLTIDLPLQLDWTYFPLEEVLWRCCLDPLLDWVRNDEEIRAGEPNPASVRSYPPKITLTGCAEITKTFRQGWEEQWGPLNHSVKGDRHCLEGFFQPRDAKTIGKT